MAEGLAAAVGALHLGAPVANPIQSKIDPQLNDQENFRLRCDEIEEVPQIELLAHLVAENAERKGRINGILARNPFVRQLLQNNVGYAQLLNNLENADGVSNAPKKIYLVGRKGIGKSYLLTHLIRQVTQMKNFKLLIGMGGTTLCPHAISFQLAEKNSFSIVVTPMKEHNLRQLLRGYWERTLREKLEKETIEVLNAICQSLGIERPATPPAPLPEGVPFVPPPNLQRLIDHLIGRIQAQNQKNTEDTVEFLDYLSALNRMQPAYEGPYPFSVEIVISSPHAGPLGGVKIIDTRGLTADNKEKGAFDSLNNAGSLPDAITLYCSELNRDVDPLLNSLAQSLNGDVISRFGILVINQKPNKKVLKDLVDNLGRKFDNITNAKLYIENEKRTQFQTKAVNRQDPVRLNLGFHTPALAVNAKLPKDATSLVEWMGRILLKLQISELTELERIAAATNQQLWNEAKVLFSDVIRFHSNFVGEIFSQDINNSPIFTVTNFKQYQAMAVRSGHYYNLDVYDATRSAVRGAVNQVIQKTLQEFNHGRIVFRDEAQRDFVLRIFVPMVSRNLQATLGGFDNITRELAADAGFWGRMYDRASRRGAGVVGDLHDMFRNWFKAHPFGQRAFLQEVERFLNSGN